MILCHRPHVHTPSQPSGMPPSLLTPTEPRARTYEHLLSAALGARPPCHEPVWDPSLLAPSILPAAAQCTDVTLSTLGSAPLGKVCLSVLVQWSPQPPLHLPYYSRSQPSSRLPPSLCSSCPIYLNVLTQGHPSGDVPSSVKLLPLALTERMLSLLLQHNVHGDLM